MGGGKPVWCSLHGVFLLLLQAHPGRDVVAHACRFGDDYYVYLLPDADAEEQTQADGKPRVQLVIVPRATGEPRPRASWQVVLAFVLFLLTLASTVRTTGPPACALVQAGKSCWPLHCSYSH